MRLRKQPRLLTLMFFIVLVLSSQVLAWGVLPARQLAPFTENTQQLKLTLKNTDFSDGYFEVSFAGDLAEFASYVGGVVHIPADQMSIDIPFTLELPAELEPGKRTLKIILKEIPSQNSGTTINSLLTLVAEVVVNAPQQGNFISAKLFIDQGSESDEVPFTISILNKGDDAIVVYADVLILSPTNQKVASWSTDKLIIDYLGNSKIETRWRGEKQAGLYYAEITLHYGDKQQILREEFFIGNQEVISETISSSDFSLGDIVPLEVTAVNKWNDVMRGVFADIYVLTQDGQLVQQFKSAPEDILPNAKKQLIAYWNTNNLLTGYYDLNVIINYPGGQTQKSYPVIVSLDRLQVNNQLTGQVISDDAQGSQTSIFIILLIVLIISNVIIILYFRRMKQGGTS